MVKTDKGKIPDDFADKTTPKPEEKSYAGGDPAMVAMDVRFSEQPLGSFVTREELHAALISAYHQRSTPGDSPVAQRSSPHAKSPRKKVLGTRSPMPTAGSPSERIITEAMRREFWYGLVGLLLGLASIVGGVILGIRGAVGATSWSARLLGLESNLNDAGPGVVLFIVGLFMIIATKPRYVLKRLRDGK